MSPIRPTVQVAGEWLDAEHHRLRDFLTRVAEGVRIEPAGYILSAFRRLAAELGLAA